ncbi:hypothetical protein ACFSKU_07935 [Pontibacter silvestris]|uniref:STAS/SEC14 domain-containing protein n=1 Tax=Pontibacter silvestris TaxID=2305183 RepID=A0ABW4WYL9_9BACT|nr:hypothetical protein [Pontibacter silvestris]MCC9138518.1 hypothetical protein [Pontibacter silvestris]
MYSKSENTGLGKSKTLISKNSCYELMYDSTKNRVYLVINGFWKSIESVPDYLQDWKRTLLFVRSGFTLLADFTAMITHPQSIADLHIQAQNLIVKAGIKKAALVESKDRIAVLQNQAIVKQTNLPAESFVAAKEAESWLDSFVAS